jgi:hypothetical protein
VVCRIGDDVDRYNIRLKKVYMKKILVALLMLTALSANADGWHRHYGGNGGNFLLPMIIGGVIGYEINKHNEGNRDEYRREEPRYQQPPVPQRGVIIDGVLYVEALQFDQGCNCYRKILIPRQ